MARTARKQLADMRAMEEEDMRMTMHGSGKHFYGAGATPSMGLSQFRGGGTKKGMTRKTARKAYEDETESEEEMEDMEGGQIGSLAARLASRFIAKPVSTAIVPRLTARVSARPTSTALIPLGPLGRPVARPALSARQYGRMFQQRPTASPFVRGPTAAISRAATRFGPTAARLGAYGATIGAVGSFLDDQFRAADAGDAGYFDDYAGEEYGDEFVPPTTGEFAPEGTPLIPAEGEIPEGMTPDELAWYLRSGNLPMRYAMAASKRKRGKGKLKIIHEGSGMADVVGRMTAKARKKMEEEEAKRRAAEAEMKREELKKKMKGQKVPSFLEQILNPKPPKVGTLEDRIYEEARKRRAPVASKLREAAAEKAKKGAGKKVSARAEIVRKVMKERGCSLPQASKIVKEEGLY